MECHWGVIARPSMHRLPVHPRQTGSLMSTTPSKHDNPLLDFSDLPRFGEIRPEHVTPALDILLADAAAAVQRAAEPITPASWADVVEPVARATEPLSRASALVAHLHPLPPPPELPPL